jgi:hypothetical protein
MDLFLYLNQVWHVKAWVEGGVVPLNLASAYRSHERSGTRTPDENVVHDSPVDLRRLNPRFKVGPDVRDLSTKNVYVDGWVPDLEHVSYYEEDGIVLCLCLVPHPFIAWRLGRKAACVRILDVARLRDALDRQLECRSQIGPCEYTRSRHQRHHFLKGEEDAWQREFRLFWKTDGPREVRISPRIAELYEIYPWAT